MRKPKREYIGILYCLPYVVVFLFGMIIPMFYALYLSFFKQSLLGGATFAGFDNFIRAFKDEALWGGFKNVLIYAAIQIPMNLILSLVAALILDSQRIRHIAVPRILLFLPYAVPGVIAALMWGYIYGDKYGLFGQIAGMLDVTAPNMLSKQLMLFAIANICTWCFLGYNMLIYYSALIGIPNDLYESARIDGASELRIAWSVKIPQIKSTIVMTVLFSVIGTLQLFNEPNILRTSAPDVINSSYTPNIYTYNLAFNGQNVNYAAAVSLVVGIIVMALVAVVKIIGNKWERSNRKTRSKSLQRRDAKLALKASKRSKSLQRRDAKLALKASKRYKRMQQREPAPKLTGKQRVLNWLLHIIMVLMVIYCLVPLLWVIFSSTKTSEGIFSSFGLWFDDKNVFWQNVQDTFAYQNGAYTRWLFNTIMYAAVAGVGATIIATFAGYAIATMRFPGRNALLAVILAFMSIPSTVITVPLFLMYSKIGLVGTPWAVIIPQLATPFGLYLMIIYAQTSIPVSLIEAAKLDGASTWTIFWKVGFPLLSPGFVTVLLFTLVGVWNNYFLPLIMLSDTNDYPLTVGLNMWLKMGAQGTANGQVPNNLIITGSLIAVVPLIIAFMFLQKYWQSGLAAGSVKQ